MRVRIGRRAVAWLAPVLAAATLAACASGGGGRTYSRLRITGDEIRKDGYGTAYEALTHHRELVVFEDRIGFEGGDDRSGLGRDRLEYTIPLVVLNGDYRLTDPITILRRIDAEDIVEIRLYRASMVPPEYRKPGAQGGVIAVVTR